MKILITNKTVSQYAQFEKLLQLNRKIEKTRMDIHDSIILNDSAKKFFAEYELRELKEKRQHLLNSFKSFI